VGAPPSHAEKAVGVGGKSGAKWRNQSDQLRIAMSASKSGPQVTHLADNASLLTNAVVMPGWLWCMLSTAQSQLAHKPSTASTTKHSHSPPPPPPPPCLHNKAMLRKHRGCMCNAWVTVRKPCTCITTLWFLLHLFLCPELMPCLACTNAFLAWESTFLI